MIDFARENIVFIVSLILIAGFAVAAPQLRNMLGADTATSTSTSSAPIIVPVTEPQTTTVAEPAVVTPSTNTEPVTAASTTTVQPTQAAPAIKTTIPKSVIRGGDDDEGFDN